ncbi:metallophosphoesterase [Salibacterium salarium]|uniref:Metallophosphoesterase n=2 Tax=Salibacterium salarium TaxID=284579 RepID=A0A428MUU0_9BACI|nr:metallophosphoesterase [Salibacterium salarium]
MTKKRWTLIILVIVVSVIVAKSFMDTNYFKIDNVTFSNNKLPEDTSIKMLQISDLHNKTFGKNNEKLISAAVEADPDIIVMTGDLIDESTSNMEQVFQLMEKMADVTTNIYFITGNHEWLNPGTEEILEGLKERGITILDNTHTQVSVDKAIINLAGVDDYETNHENLSQAFRGLKNDYYTVLLSHAPGVVANEESTQADLVLSGHTHGGQIRLPFVGALVAPGQGFFPKFDQGMYRTAPDQHLYIDSGLGTSIVPIRFLNQSQMTLITIKDKT